MHLSPDRLDCILVWSISKYELGVLKPLDHTHLQTLALKWDDGFMLDEVERKALKEHNPFDLEWVEMVVPGLWHLSCSYDNADWGSELLQHIAHLVADRVFNIHLRADIWSTGSPLTTTPDGTFNSLEAIILAGFPNPSLL